MRGMTMRDRGMTKAQLRVGSGKGVTIADEHFFEMAGSRDFYVYVTPRTKAKGYDALKAAMLAQGYAVSVADEAPMLPAKGYRAVKITTTTTETIADEALRQAHRWAHQRNYLHSFFKPYKTH